MKKILNKNSYPYSFYHENEDRCPTCLSKLNIDLDLDENDNCRNCREELVADSENILSKETNKTSFSKSNQKQFKEFNSELFKAYINKFSNKDKLKLLNVLVGDISTTDIKLNSLLNQISNYK